MQEKFIGFANGIHQIQWFNKDVWLIVQPWGQLVVAKLGAQVLHYQPVNQHAVFWINNMPQTSVDANALKNNGACESGFSIDSNSVKGLIKGAEKKSGNKEKDTRGGVPLCWPWFGPHVSDDQQPNHGYARISPWQLQQHDLQDASSHNAISEFVETATKLVFSPAVSISDVLSVKFEIEVSHKTLKLSLITTNISEHKQALTQALHSYFTVGNSEKVVIEGLKRYEYFDKLDKQRLKLQDSELTNITAIDRIYKHHDSVRVIDEILQREIIVSKSGSGSTVLWNPGQLHKNYGITQKQKQFICVEAANTDYEQLILKPAESAIIRQCITLRPLN
ncbi:MAG: hypothetical protein V7784_00545 [Oceanospirillaceae bacterium]